MVASRVFLAGPGEVSRRLRAVYAAPRWEQGGLALNPRQPRKAADMLTFLTAWQRTSSMRENRIKTLWQKGEAAVNGWLAIPNVFSAETMAHAGWDSLTVDMQHGVVDYQAALAMLTAISSTSAIPMVRVPWLDPGIIMKSLDAGAYGVICPMINNRAEAEKLVSCMR